MAGPTVAELQLRLTGHGLHYVTSLESALKRVGGTEIRRQLDGQARALLGIEKAAQRAGAAMTKKGGLFSGDTLGGIAKFGVAALTMKRGFEMIAGGVSSALDPLIKFDKAMAQVRIKGGYSAGATAELGAGIKQNVRNGSMFSPTQQAEAAVDLAASGLSASAVNTMLPTVMRFAQASDLQTAEASKILTNVANMFGIRTDNAQGMEKLGGQLVKAANMSTIGVTDIFHTLRYAGTQANTAGMDPAQVLAMTAILGNRGVAGSKAGTGMRNLLAAMSKPPRRGKAARQMLAKIGLTQDDLKSGLNDVPTFLKQLGQRYDRHKLSKADRLGINSMLFGQYGSTTSDVLTKAAQDTGAMSPDEADEIRRYTKEIERAGDAMKDAADIAGNTYAGKLEKLSAKFELLKISMGERFLPTIEKSIGWLDRQAAAAEKWVTKNPAAIEQMNKVAAVLANSVIPSLLKVAEVLAPIAAQSANTLGTWADAWQKTVFGDDGQRDVSPEDEKAAKKQFLKNHVRSTGLPVGYDASGNPASGPGYDAALSAYNAVEAGQASAGRGERRKRMADRYATLPTSSATAENSQMLTGEGGQSRVDVRIGVDKKGELKAMIERIAKGDKGPNLRVGTSVDL